MIAWVVKSAFSNKAWHSVNSSRLKGLLNPCFKTRKSKFFSLNKQASDPSTRWEAVRGRHTLNFPFPAWLGWSQKKKSQQHQGTTSREEVKYRRMFKCPQVPWHSGWAILPHPQSGRKRQGIRTSLQRG